MIEPLTDVIAARGAVSSSSNHITCQVDYHMYVGLSPWFVTFYYLTGVTRIYIFVCTSTEEYLGKGLIGRDLQLQILESSVCRSCHLMRTSL